MAACLTPAHADDAAMSGESGSPKPMSEHPSVRMVREDVTIDPASQHVDAKFVFHNDGPATTVSMGFPEESSGDAAGSTLFADKTRFQSYIDGNPIRVRLVGKPKDNSGPDDVTVWWTKRVHFAAGQTRVVVDRYTGGGGGDSTDHHWFTYVLTTGASWKGPIGRAIITCDLTNVPYSPIVIRPDNFEVHGNKIVWDLRNVEPKQDIAISWYTAYLNVLVNGRLVISKLRTNPYIDENDVEGLAYSMQWPVDEWTPVHSRRRGNDVWLPAKAAAAWLGGKFRVLEPNHRVEIICGDRSVIATVGSRDLEAPEGRIEMPYVCDQENGRGGMGGATMVSLTSVAKALGGTANYDADDDKMVVSIPH